MNPPVRQSAQSADYNKPVFLFLSFYSVTDEAVLAAAEFLLMLFTTMAAIF